MTLGIQDQLQHALGDSYVLQHELPAGGMSRLFLATEPTLERPVVVKLLPPELSSAVSAERFRREMLVTARLVHPHILPVLNAGARDGLLYYVMPFVAGESLRARLAREGRLSITESVRILRELADALACAHGVGVVHRDVKPDNVLLEHGHAVLADFGVARALEQATLGERLTGTSLGIGTPGYMAPEQLVGDPVIDGRADLYALGVIAYEMLAGTPPFPRDSSQRLVSAHLTETPTALRDIRPDVPPPVAALVMRLLAKSPADRPATSEEVAAALEAAPPIASSPRARRVTYIAIAVASVAALGVVGYRAMHENGGHQQGAPIRAPVATAPSPTMGTVATDPSRSVAVLPFVNMSAEPQNEYFSDGMTEELIDALAKVEGLRVAARTSSFAFKGRNEDIGAIGGKLHVQAVVEGSVRRQGRRLRITAQLVNVADGYHLWSETYDRELRDVFQVQDEISRAIVNVLRVKLRLTNRSDTTVVRAGTADPEAHDLYLRGRYLWNQRTYESLVSATRYFERAIERDSLYAQAYAALAESYLLFPVYSSSVRPMGPYRRAKATAQHALALDSSLAMAHAALAYAMLLSDYDWSGAAAGFQRALALDPNEATARDWYAVYLNAVGRQSEATAQGRQALALDPLSPVLNVDLASQLALAGDYDAASRQIRATIELFPSFPSVHWVSCYVSLLRHESRAALEECERFATPIGDATVGLGQLAYAYAAAGDTGKATAVLQRLNALATRQYVAPTELVYANLGLGRRSDALAWLDSAVTVRDPTLTNYLGDPLLDPLRADPRFARLRARMHLR